MSNLEIVGVRCPDCEQMVSAGDNHACWAQELGMQAFEDAMWARYQEEEAIEPLEEDFSDLEDGPDALTELEESLEPGRQMARDEAIFLGGPWI